jgi:hypothetical protein
LKQALEAKTFEQAFFDKLKEFGTVDRLIEEYSAFKMKYRDVEAKLAAAESRAEEAERSEEAMYEKVKSLAPHGSCACSYDKPGDVCMHHSPQLSQAEQRLARVREIIDKAPHDYSGFGCGLAYGHIDHCTCWKSAALKEMEV